MFFRDDAEAFRGKMSRGLQLTFNGSKKIINPSPNTYKQNYT